MKSISLFASLAAVSVLHVATGCSSKSDTSTGTAGASGNTAGATGSSAGASGNTAGASGSTAGTSGSSGGTSGNGEAGTTATGEAGDTGSSGAGTSGSGAPGWTVIPLLDDHSDPSNVLNRAGVDDVSGIYFNSLDDGWVTTRQGTNSDTATGGAIFKAKSTSLTSILFSGNRDGNCFVSAGGGIDFQGLEPSPTGFVALAYACDVIQSHDGGKTFALEKNQMSDQLSINAVLAMRPVPQGGTVMAMDNYVATTAGNPGPTADWTTVWAPPPATPTTPATFPDADCQVTPTAGVPPERTAMYVSPQADFMAYVAHSDDLGPIICISKGSVATGGLDSPKNFLPSALPNIPDDIAFAAPDGVVFTSDTVGITFYANNIYPGEAYVDRTIDGGTTWKAATLPAVAKKAIEFQSAFFAPDGMSGWIVGYNYDSSAPLLLHTADGGVTWDSNSGDLSTKALAGGGLGKLHTGFALDATHLWVGGDSGILLANSAGGM
jgi:Photosynthesis system II assembly factor YCF48